MAPAGTAKSKEPEVALARQRAEQDLTDLNRTRKQSASPASSGFASHATAPCVTSQAVSCCLRQHERRRPPRSRGRTSTPQLRRRIELAAEDVVVAHEESPGPRVRTRRPSEDRLRHSQSRGRRTRKRVTVIRSTGVRRIEVKGRKRGQPVQADDQRVVQGPTTRRHLLVVRRLGSVERPRPRPADGAEPGHVSGLRQEGSGGRPLLRSAGRRRGAGRTRPWRETEMNGT